MSGGGGPGIEPEAGSGTGDRAGAGSWDGRPSQGRGLGRGGGRAGDWGWDRGREWGGAALTWRSACSSFQQRLSYTTLSDLALALLDGTVFEIVQGLLEIQHLTEKSLYNQRLRLQNEHRGARAGKGRGRRRNLPRASLVAGASGGQSGV